MNRGTIAYVIVFMIIAVIYLLILELSKNTLPGFVIAVLAMTAILIWRGSALKAASWNIRWAILSWIILLAVFGLNLKLTEPPYRRVPAVDVKHPDVTGEITTVQGKVTGVYNADHSVEVYAGIPYAKPPVGELRFREPAEPEAYEGVLACDHFAPMAMQKRNAVIYDSLTRILGYHNYEISPDDNYREPLSEDCLYLNIWKPAGEVNKPLPVLFYVHGGSLMTGQSYYTDYRGEDLAKRGIIVVNFAYRLGVFGYYADEALAAESANGTTGNYGLLDQIQALTWVRENISAFGGDPEQITIAGESAGSSSVNALCVSPLTEGMFVRAIAESSSVLQKKPYHTFRSFDEALEMGAQVREEMGVATSDELRKIPAEKLVQTQYQNSAMTLDGYAITEMPYETYERGANHEQALLHGFNAKEADAFLLGYKATRDNYLELMEPVLGEYVDEMAKLVPADSPQRDEHFIIDSGGEAKGALNEVYSAAWFTYSHYLWNDYMVKEGRPSYEYYFTKNNPSLSNYHAGELPYAYGNLWRYKEGLYAKEDFELSDIMQQYWVNFVKTGDPNGDGLPTWQMRDADQTKLLELGEKIEPVEDPNLEIYEILDKYQNQE